MVDFLIIGGGTITNSILWLFIDKKMKYGYSISSGYRFFEVSDDYEFYGTVCKEEGGKRYIAVSGVRWFTSMRDDYPPKLVLSRKYVEGEYKKFDNFNAINIDNTKDIPVDYTGLMGVPITFIDKWNPEQFELIGLPNIGIVPEGWNGMTEEFIKLYYEQGNTGCIEIGNKNGYFIKDGKAIVPYVRLLIKKKIS